MDAWPVPEYFAWHESSEARRDGLRRARHPCASWPDEPLDRLDPRQEVWGAALRAVAAFVARAFVASWLVVAAACASRTSAPAPSKQPSLGCSAREEDGAVLWDAGVGAVVVQQANTVRVLSRGGGDWRLEVAPDEHVGVGTHSVVKARLTMDPVTSRWTLGVEWFDVDGGRRLDGAAIVGTDPRWADHRLRLTDVAVMQDDTVWFGGAFYGDVRSGGSEYRVTGARALGLVRASRLLEPRWAHGLRHVFRTMVFGLGEHAWFAFDGLCSSSTHCVSAELAPTESSTEPRLFESYRLSRALSAERSLLVVLEPSTMHGQPSTSVLVPFADQPDPLSVAVDGRWAIEGFARDAAEWLVSGTAKGRVVIAGQELPEGKEAERVVLARMTATGKVAHAVSLPGAGFALAPFGNQYVVSARDVGKGWSWPRRCPLHRPGVRWVSAEELAQLRSE